MAEFLAAKTINGHLAPLDPEVLEKVGAGEILKVKATKPRDYTKHKRFFALLKACWELEQISNHFGSMDELRAWITVQAGHCHTYHFPGDLVAKVPKSIAFDKMDDIEFNAFYDRAVNVVLTKFLPTYKPKDFYDYIDRFVRF